VSALLAAQPDRVVSVYQHVRAIRVRIRVAQVLSHFQREAHSFSCCTYESGTVSPLFFSLSKERVASLHATLAAFLGRHASTRVHLLHEPGPGAA